jgi:hypothetical protein
VTAGGFIALRARRRQAPLRAARVAAPFPRALKRRRLDAGSRKSPAAQRGGAKVRIQARSDLAVARRDWRVGVGAEARLAARNRAIDRTRTLYHPDILALIYRSALSERRIRLTRSTRRKPNRHAETSSPAGRKRAKSCHFKLPPHPRVLAVSLRRRNPARRRRPAAANSGCRSRPICASRPSC